MSRIRLSNECSSFPLQDLVRLQKGNVSQININTRKHKQNIIHHREPWPQ